MSKLLVAFGFLAVNLYTYHFLASEAVIPPRASFESFPLELDGGWYCPQQDSIGDAAVENLGVTDYLLCNFRNAETRDLVNVYVGYHATQVREQGGGSGENSIHPPAHCLPGSGWDIIQNQTAYIDAPGLPQQRAPVKRMLIAKGDARQLVYYWYQSRGRVVSDDWKKILFVGLDRALKQRTDGSLVRFTMPVLLQDEERAERAFQSLAPQVVERLPEYVPE